MQTLEIFLIPYSGGHLYFNVTKVRLGLDSLREMCQTKTVLITEPNNFYDYVI